MNQRTRSTLALAALLLGGGCEIAIPLIVAEATKETEAEPFPGETPLTMELLEAEGHVLDSPVDSLSLSVPFGVDRFGGFLFVQVDGSPDATTSLQIETCDLQQGGDPYGGLEEPFPELDGGPAPEDLRPMTPCGDAAQLVSACADDGNCTQPQTAHLERVATADGVELTVDVTWQAGNALFLRFREVR